MTNFTESLKGYAFQGVGADMRGRHAVGIVAFAVAAAFSAQIAVPLPWTPVPITLQPMIVILAGAMLGPRLGALAMASYVTVGGCMDAMRCDAMRCNEWKGPGGMAALR